ncbi:MAG: antibiotic biosynthesis monooxygenase [Chloroflexi bacterium]|nr:MAG: antibiotic biosynthesis monooxygenase [Chloroflexota bacterium]
MSTLRAPPSGSWSRFASTWGLPPMSVREVTKMAVATSELQGINRFKFHEGKLEEFKRLSARAMEIARAKDSGTLQYEIYFNDDQSECIVLERYRDSEALLEHGANLGELSQAILATGSVTGACLGEPSAELKALLAGSPVQLFTPYLSLARR